MKDARAIPPTEEHAGTVRDFALHQYRVHENHLDDLVPDFTMSALREERTNAFVDGHTYRDTEVKELVDALRAFGTERRNCQKRIERDGSLNHGPTCLSPVKSEYTAPEDYCAICRANTALAKYPQP